jgi:hypothetical protein
MPANSSIENVEFVRKNRNTLLREHGNKFLLVYEGALVGSFDTYETAAAEGVRRYGLQADFLVYHMLETEPVNFVIGAAF